LLDWQIDRARINLERIPADAKFTIVGGVESTNQSGAQLFRDYGFSSTRSSYTMKIDFTLGQRPPIPVWPDGVQVVSLAENGNFEMFVRGWYESFRDHRGWMERKWEDIMERWTHMTAKDRRFNPNYWWAVLIDGELAAVNLSQAEGHEREDYAYVMVLGTLRGFRKRGLALALLHYCFNVFYNLGKSGVTLGVDGSSLTGAVRLYETAGMHIHKQYDSYERIDRDGIEITNQGQTS
jgi:ribosomal protein S18 acetylase RimI-like enzyme